MSLVIVDTGVANLSSVKFAFERLNVPVIISDAPEVITQADRVVIPGVGAAEYAMQKINDKALAPVLTALTQPVLGICLGMQILFETLDEGANPVTGLGLIPGHIRALDTHGAPSPHMGWNNLEIKAPSPLLNGLKTGDYAYFVHSFAAPLSEHTLVSTTYGDSFSSIVRHKNVYGCQFHPERSARVGAQIFENFLKV